jgi:hypothetical protein
MKIINNAKEFDAFYHYKTDKKKRYPIEYPCIVDKVHYDGGLMGDSVDHMIIYFPKNADKESYFLGYIRGREIED